MSAFLRIETLRQEALARIRAAVAAANAPGAPQSPLKGLYVPAHRWEKLRPDQAPFVHVVAKSDAGAGNSRELPQFDLVGTLHINVLHAATRANAPDLDAEAGAVAEALCLTLLEDPTFLMLFGWVAALRIEIDDGVVSGSAGSEYDCVAVQIELEVSGDQKLFEPAAGIPLTRIDTHLAVGGSGSVEQQIPIQQE